MSERLVLSFGNSRFSSQDRLVDIGSWHAEATDVAAHDLILDDLSPNTLIVMAAQLWFRKRCERAVELLGPFLASSAGRRRLPVGMDLLYRGAIGSCDFRVRGRIGNA